MDWVIDKIFNDQDLHISMLITLWRYSCQNHFEPTNVVAVELVVEIEWQELKTKQYHTPLYSTMSVCKAMPNFAQLIRVN